MTTPAAVTVCCHDLAPSAGVRSMLLFVRWLRRQGVVVETISLWGGEYAPEFGEATRLHVVNEPWGTDGAAGADPGGFEPVPPGGRARNRRRRWAGRASAGGEAARALQLVGLHRPAEVVRSTTLRRRLDGDAPVWLAQARAARLLHYLPPGRRVVAALGELDPPVGGLGLDADDQRLLVSRPDLWVAGGDAAAASLRADGVQAPIAVVGDMIHEPAGPGRRAETRRTLAHEVGVPVDAFLVSSMGEIDWWDTPDLFIQVAWQIHRRSAGREVHFCWVGGRSTPRMLWPMRHDARHAGLGDHFHVTGDHPDPMACLAASDVLLVTRRGAADPPLLREIEAMGPLVVRPPFGEADPFGPAPGRVVVPFLDEDAMAEAALGRITSPEPHHLAEAVRAAHAADTVGPRLLAALGGSDRP